MLLIDISSVLIFKTLESDSLIDSLCGDIFGSFNTIDESICNIFLLLGIFLMTVFNNSMLEILRFS